MKPRLGLAFSDFWPGFVPERWSLVQVLQEAFDVQVESDAEITVCGPFGRRHARRTGTKVFCTGEMWPYLRGAYDFWIDFDLEPRPRHIRWPLFMWLLYRDRQTGVRPATRPLEDWRRRPGFCNFIYNNPRCHTRNEFFDVLSSLRTVTAPGTVRRNTSSDAGPRFDRGWRRNKIAYQREFRFTIAFEAVEKPGYTTEKLLDALVAGTIPIYWGNPAVAVDFRPGSFINAYDFASLRELAEHVVAVDADPELARRYLEISPWYDDALDRARDELIAFFGEILAASKERSLRRSVRPLWVFPVEEARVAGRVVRGWVERQVGATSRASPGLRGGRPGGPKAAPGGAVHGR